MDQMGQESGLANTSRDNACVNGHPGLCYIERCFGVVPRVLDPEYEQDGALVRGSPYIKMVRRRNGGADNRYSPDDTDGFHCLFLVSF